MSRKVYATATIKIILRLEEGEDAEEVICQAIDSLSSTSIEDIEVDSTEIIDSK